MNTDDTNVDEMTAEEITKKIQIMKEIPWFKAPFFKDGTFSKTATFSTAANVITLVWFGLSMFKGLPINPIDTMTVAAVLGIANGTYVGNNMVKK